MRSAGELAAKEEGSGVDRHAGLRVMPVVDMDENMEELSFVPSAVSSSAQWQEPRFMCDRQCWVTGVQYLDIASVMVVDNSELHTINICRDGYNLGQGERKQPAVNTRQWRFLVTEKRSRGKLATGCRAHGYDRKIMEIHAARKVYYAKNLLKDAVVAVSLNKEWREMSPFKEELTLLQKKRNMQLPDMKVRRAIKAGKRTTGRS